MARKPRSSSFNRAIFDALAYYAHDGDIRKKMSNSAEAVLKAYESALNDAKFLEAVESDTAGLPNTSTRLRIWGELLKQALEIEFRVPTFDDAEKIIRP